MTLMHTRTMEEAILAGELDEALGSLKSAIETRQAQIRSVAKPTDFGIGDKVVFNNSCGTRYLVGHTATITGMKRTKVVVKLDKPMGRFARIVNGEQVSADITVPISIIDAV